MPTQNEINAEKERLYESSALRDDLNDDEATVLLNWGQTQIDRLAQEYPDALEEKARFLRQLLKNINRFVGQREFNDYAGQAKYMKKVSMYLPPLGWPNLSENELFAVLPQDPADMASNLAALLNLLTPTIQKGEPAAQDDPPQDQPDETYSYKSFKDSMIGRHQDNHTLENDKPANMNQANGDTWMGVEPDYGEE